MCTLEYVLCTELMIATLFTKISVVDANLANVVHALQPS
jgi:hypothetical protein